MQSTERVGGMRNYVGINKFFDPRLNVYFILDTMTQYILQTIDETSQSPIINAYPHNPY